MECHELIGLKPFVECLIECSEKAARIAQICRDDKNLFDLLIEEKKDDEKNKRFVQDFKTLADVLVQETVKWDVSRKFPAIGSSIQGEENNSFQNLLGETIEIELSSSSEKTTDLLVKVLDGNLCAAKALVNAVYADIQVDFTSLPVLSGSIHTSKIGIWIDPIDSTAEYVRGNFEEKTDYGLVISGLKCVCVLIGAYNLDTGYPFFGVVNQPFYSKNINDRWLSKYYWGIFSDGFRDTSIILSEIEQRIKRIVTSSFEDKILLEMMESKYNVKFAAGAGYKALAVACRYADLYVLSQSTTYFWDTCGPHSVLRALGGGMVDFKRAVYAKNLETHEDLESLQLKYTSDQVSEPSFSNAGGIIGYKNPDDLIEFIHYLQGNMYLPKQ